MPIRFIDSHTEGEPTRFILDGGPDLGNGPLKLRSLRLSEQFDDFRRAVILEPRGHDAIVGALLCEPTNPECSAGIIFFNNTGYLGMCGHGMIGVAVTLAHIGRAETGEVKVETPVGVVTVTLQSPNDATIENVASYRLHKDIELDVDGIGKLRGDVAWGGNWFFLTDQPPCPIELRNQRQLTATGMKVKQALIANGITGDDGAEIDHVEFFEYLPSFGVDSRNFVLCPGDEYDRSPCGTGTSAKLACLAADGRLAEGAIWVQESVIGSRFEARYRRDANGDVIPSISGRAWICAEGKLLQQPGDPFAAGIS